MRKIRFLIVNALLIALVTVATSISCVVLGVVGAYGAVTGILAVCNPSRTNHGLAALVPYQSQVGGD